MRNYLGALMILVLVAIPLSAKVDVEFDETVNLAVIRTFAWVEGTRARSPDGHRIIVREIEDQLALAGLQKVDSDPDVYVTYHVSFEEKERVTVDTYGQGPPTWGDNLFDTGVQYYDVGTLVVDIRMGEDKHLVWRGMATKAVGSDMKENAKKVKKVLEKMFKKFPPKYK